MIIGGDLMERLRPLVSSKNWDYYVLWRLSEDQRFLQWMSCCCGGGYDDENVSGNGCGDYNDKLKELVYPFSSISSPPCRDLMLQHPRTTPPCHLLADLPSSIPLDSGIYAQALMLDQAMWLNFCSERSDSTIQGITFGTRVLIPLPIGLVELFVTKQVHEDQETIEFVTSQYNITLKEQAMNPSFFDQNIANETHPKLFSYDHENNETALPNPFHSHQQSIVENTKNVLFGELSNREYLENRDIVKKGNGNSESISDCSEEDREGGKCENRNGKGHQSKNLLAERKRRKKLNDRLFALRALVPLITKMDKASILGDAILYVKELQKQVKELQQDLESHSEDDCDTNISIKLKNRSCGQSEFMNQISAKNENVIPLKQEDCSGTYDHKPRQMEPQVEVVQLDGNELFVKVFCEQKAGGLVRLMEGFNSLGLEVINVTITSFRSLVSNVFRLEMKDSKMLEADYVKDSLLEIIGNYSHL